MGVLAKPDLPPGPLRVLSDQLHQLHHHAGRPSLRRLASEVGVSRTTVAAIFSEPRVPQWGLLELVVEALGGDVTSFHALWLSASERPSARREPAPSEPTFTGRALRQAPAPAGVFSGRGEFLAQMDAALDPRSSGVPLCVLTGTAGVGKTALALEWIHRRADRFPGGVLYLDLHGFHAAAPASTHDVLAEFIRALGGPERPVPSGTRERAALYRTLVAAHPVLVMLDNAHSVDQIDQLLPGDPEAAALVTSRDDLSGAVIRYGATRIEVPLMSAGEAEDLLLTLVGERVATEPDAARALAAQCARLPLALRIAAELVASRRDETVTDLLAELRASTLALLDRGDDHSAVRTVFSWSYRRLTADAARLFRLLAIHPGETIDYGAAAALSGIDRPASRRHVEELARVHLLERRRFGRFALHDLLREYATELLATEAPAELHGARRRLFDAYCAEAAAATAVAFRRPVPAPSLPAPSAQAFVDEALRWLRIERPTLLAVAHASPFHAVLLSHSMHEFLDVEGYYAEALGLHQCAWTEVLGDPAQEAAVLNRLGTVHRRQGNYRAALADHHLAAQACRTANDRAELAHTLHNIGVVEWRTGRYQAAQQSLTRALELQSEMGDGLGEGGTRCSLGIVERRLGRYRESVGQYREASRIFEELGDLAGLSKAANNAAVVHSQVGDYAEAECELHRALTVQRDRGDRAGQSVVLINLGQLLTRTGRLEEAEKTLDDALAIARDARYPASLADALRGLGVARGRLGRVPEALRLLRTALRLGRLLDEDEIHTGALIDLAELLLEEGREAESDPLLREAEARATGAGERYETARAHAGLARAAAANGLTVESQERWRAAVTAFTDLGIPRAAWPSIARAGGGLSR